MLRVEPPRFADRREAGRQLGARLKHLRLDRPIIYALLRGGVPVGVELAAALDAPLDLVLVASSEHLTSRARGRRGSGWRRGGDGVKPRGLLLSPARVRPTSRRRRLYLADRPWPDPRGRAAVVLDDGLATGATAWAALHRCDSAARRSPTSPCQLPRPTASPRSGPKRTKSSACTGQISSAASAASTAILPAHGRGGDPPARCCGRRGSAVGNQSADPQGPLFLGGIPSGCRTKAHIITRRDYTRPHAAIWTPRLLPPHPQGFGANTPILIRYHQMPPRT